MTVREEVHTSAIDDPGPARSEALLVGLDVGSTTVKAVVLDPATGELRWSDYRRHETRQPEKVREFLLDLETAYPPPHRLRIFITGSGGASLAEKIGAKFVQEVNAVSLAVEHLHPEAGSVIELGGQDAKIIIWLDDPASGQKRKLASMNDRCAGGTGAVIDKISTKLQLTNQQMRALEFADVKLHPVAGKCGVFAETDINGLQKQGVASTELIASLFEAIVQQNLSVLTRGNTLRPRVLLLGGPNTFIPALREAWRANIPRIWHERGVALPPDADPRELIVVPENAQYFAAIGAALYGRQEDDEVGQYQGAGELDHYIEVGRRQLRQTMGEPGLVDDQAEADAFAEQYAPPPFHPARFSPGQVVAAYLGLDGGSTSTKGVLLSPEGEVLAKAYQLSQGNPVQDGKEIIAALRQGVEAQGAELKVLGMGTTGYAKDILRDTLGADVALVETVAHTQSALHYYRDVDVIVDVGGQDIKVIMLRDGKVRDFKLNTQCSAGNGYFLQSTARRFGYDVRDYASAAFGARRVPVFSYGCAVFLETDIVNFQQLGWEREEIMAGLARVLPKNIWLYVVQEPNLRRLGSSFVLQGGTQYNLAAVKSQHDFIKSRVPDARILVHRHAGESGAIGAAIEARRVARDRASSFIGLEEAERLAFTTTRDSSTRCDFCKNKCLRTFVDTRAAEGGTRRFIIASCEKGEVERVEEMRSIKERLDTVRRDNPSFVEFAARDAFRSYNPEKVTAISASPRGLLGAMARAQQRRHGRAIGRDDLRIGIPRVLNLYSVAPFFTAYLESLGVPHHHLVFSDFTDEKLYREGSRRGSIDACFPSKLVISHIHNLLYHKNVQVIFFPILLSLWSELKHTLDSAACPSVASSPEVARAAFTKEGDVFAERGVRYYSPTFNLAEPALFEHQMFDFFHDFLGVTRIENRLAMERGYEAQRVYANVLQRQAAREVLDRLEAERRVGVVCLGRPYHADPGLNHGILEEIQKKGYPIFSMQSLPVDPDLLERLFGPELASGEISHPMEIRDVWKNAYSENSSVKIWAAKYVARHPNLVALDLSNFRCGHDSPIYSVVESIVEATGTPYFTFHDIDENRPAASIKIRVETIDYFLRRYQDQLQERARAEAEIGELVEARRRALQARYAGTGTAAPRPRTWPHGPELGYPGGEASPKTTGA